MFYEFPITVAVGKTRVAPEVEEIKLTHGLIHRLEVEFPDGCDGLVHARVMWLDHQVWPTNPNEYFTSDGHVIVIDDYFELYGPPYLLKIEGWSEALLYSHTVRVRIGVLPKAVADHVYGKMSKSDINTLREAFGIPIEE